MGILDCGCNYVSDWDYSRGNDMDGGSMNTVDQSGADERAKFVLWCNTTYYDDPEWDAVRNCFKEHSVHMAFKGWQAALASIQPAPQPAQPIAIAAHVFRGPHGYELSGRLPNDTPLNLGLNTLYTTPQPFPAVQSSELPELPDCDSYCTHADCHEYDVYTADQMRDYARQSIASIAATIVANTAQGKPCQKFEYNPEHTDHCDFCKCHKSDHAIAAKKG